MYLFENVKRNALHFFFRLTEVEDNIIPLDGEASKRYNVDKVSKETIFYRKGEYGARH